jgi:hypothetical protein
LNVEFLNVVARSGRFWHFWRFLAFFEGLVMAVVSGVVVEWSVMGFVVVK